ncbi:MAG: DUF2059 domain-containing protein [Cytophagales bacterium]|nr:DUF2059 domain-containing protein [Cytophagales bacterium]
MKTTILSFLLALSTPFVLQAQDDEYKQLLSRYFEVSGSKETFEVAIKQTIQTMRTQTMDLDDEAWDELEKEFLNTSIEDLVEILVPVYSKHLSADDLLGVIAFYESPVGQKLAEKTPLITQESMQSAGQWGMQLGQKVMEKIEEKKKN